jgi:hypothetical protein
MENNLLLSNILFLKNIVKQTFHYGVRMNEITKFADDYYTMTKINPFKHKR